MAPLTILALAFVQNIAFAMVSRSRNRSSMTYHAICSVVSNGIFFFTLRELVISDLSPVLVVPYVVGTVAGSLFGASVSMRIERAIGAVADS